MQLEFFKKEVKFLLQYLHSFNINCTENIDIYKKTREHKINVNIFHIKLRIFMYNLIKLTTKVTG